MITDEYGLHAVPWKRNDKPEPESTLSIVYRSPTSLAVDGDLSEWSNATDRGLNLNTATMAPRESPPHDGLQTRPRVTHDTRNLYIALSYAEARPEPLRERGRLVNSGDYLTISLRSNRKPDKNILWDDYLWNVGHDPDGHTVATGDGPKGTASVKLRSPQTGMTSFEIGVPLDSIRDEARPDANHLDLTLLLHDAEQGPGPVGQWHHLKLRLHRFSQGEESAGLALAAAMPDLVESRWLLREVMDAQVAEWPSGRGFIKSLLTRYRDTPFAAWILRAAHERLDVSSGTAPRKELRHLAEQAGVNQETLDWYDAYPALLVSDPTRVTPLDDNIRMLTVEKLTAAQSEEHFRKIIPRLDQTDTSIRFFSAMIRTLKPSPQAETELIAWFLKTFPGHPRSRDFLHGAWDLARRMDEAQAPGQMDQVLADGQVPADKSYRFRRTQTHTGHARIENWHLLGPFPANLIEANLVDLILPHEQGRITLKEQYRMQDRLLRWQPYESTNGVVEMRTAFTEPYVRSLGYAAAWVESPRAQWAMLEVGSYGPCTVWLNNRLVYFSAEDHKDAWLPKGYTAKGRFPVRAVPVWLPEKWSTILVQSIMEERGWQFGLEFIEREGRGPVEGLRVMRRGGPVDVQVADVPRPPLPVGGLKGEYYDNEDLTDLKLIRMDPTLNFDWHIESPDPRIGWDRFSMRWTGRLKPRFSEPTTFLIQANDGIRFWLDGKILVDHWDYHGGRLDQAMVQLDTNREHHVRFEFYELTDYSNFRVWWQSASQPREIIPADRFSSSWHRKDTVLPPRSSAKPTGPPVFAGVRVHPRELWLPTGTGYDFQAVPVDQYGVALNAAALFDDKGQPLDTSVTWKVVPGARLNLMHQYGSGGYLKHHAKQADGVIDANGHFIGDGSRGAVTIVATANADPTRIAYAVVAVDDLPAIGPFEGQPMTIGKGFSGDMDRARIYTKALSAEIIKAHADGKPLSDNGLLGDWTLDDVVDGKFLNMAGDELSAKMISQVRHIKDETRAYVQFNGGRLEVEDHPLLNFSQETTLEAWVRRRGGGGLVIDRCRWGTVRGFRLEITGNGMRSQGLYGHGGLEAGADIENNFWTHVVAVYGKSGMRQLWADGKMIAERKGGPQVQEW